MKKPMPILILAVLPVMALASGDHAGGHRMEGHPMMHDHDMPGMHKDTHASMAGRPGDPDKVSRTIEITMDDAMRFDPDRIQVQAGETVRLFVRNIGMLQHELVIGTMVELQEHAAMMRAMPDMQHDEPNMTAPGPGQVGGMVWRFDEPGTFDFACLVPGHLEAGMVGKIEVR